MFEQLKDQVQKYDNEIDKLSLANRKLSEEMEEEERAHAAEVDELRTRVEQLHLEKEDMVSEQA